MACKTRKASGQQETVGCLGNEIELSNVEVVFETSTKNKVSAVGISSQIHPSSSSFLLLSYERPELCEHRSLSYVCLNVPEAP